MNLLVSQILRAYKSDERLSNFQNMLTHFLPHFRMQGGSYLSSSSCRRSGSVSPGFNCVVLCARRIKSECILVRISIELCMTMWSPVTQCWFNTHCCYNRPSAAFQSLEPKYGSTVTVRTNYETRASLRLGQRVSQVAILIPSTGQAVNEINL
jgi:hypothetical protein